MGKEVRIVVSVAPKDWASKDLREISDFYGLGVRLGLYLQWLSSLIANPFLHGERRSMAGAYLASSLALTIALFILVLRPECVFTAEIMVMLNIIWGGTYQVMSPFIAEFTHRKDFVMDGIQVALMLVNGSVISLSAWFWVRMASVGETDFVATPGGTSYFLFSHVKGGDLGTASRFMAFLSIWSFSTPVLAIPIYAVHKAGLVTLASVLALLTVQGFSRMAGLIYAWIFGAILGVVPPYIAYFTHTVDKWLAFRKDMNLGNWIVAGEMFLFFICSVLSIELIIAWNEISEVNGIDSTSHIILFVLGLGLFTNVIWKMARKEKEADVAESGTAFQQADSTWQ
ncbi:hypothetical protein EDD36DRAFT_464339 [Exophiala viscosa]|uniref:Uncharacterized protein n=1 Tax=Exophiala viscosa TaxID=2486360 RepID=A0AAN6DXL3_9EURO|nr:hypothetical protein EDD36DRAFT_464339 [Exophiala viscosa]